MATSKRLSLLLILAGLMALLPACKTGALASQVAGTEQVISSSTVTAAQDNNALSSATLVPSYTATTIPTSTSTSAPTQTSITNVVPTQAPSATPTITPTQTPSVTPTITPTLAIGPLEPGIYSSGGCTDFVVVKRHAYYGNLSAGFNWCVVSVQLTNDGAMIFVVSWQLTNLSEVITEVTKRGDRNNPNMYLTDNFNNRYDALTVSGEGATDIRMEKGVTYYSAFTFHASKAGAKNFTFHDDDNNAQISNIVLDKPAIYINDITMKWTPATITYFSDKWIASETEQGGFKLTNTKSPICQIMEAEPGDPQGSLINTIDIVALKYKIYRTQEPNWSLREYVLVGGLVNLDPTKLPQIHVTIPYDNSASCLEDAGSVLASVKAINP